MLKDFVSFSADLTIRLEKICLRNHRVFYRLNLSLQPTKKQRRKGTLKCSSVNFQVYDAWQITLTQNSCQ